MGMLDGYRGLIFGVANDRSIAWHVAQQLLAEGAQCGFAYLPGEKNLHRVKKCLEAGNVRDAWLHPCDASQDEDLDAIFEAASQHFGPLRFVIHSIAFADRTYLKPGKFTDTPREVFKQALDISAYTLVAMARRVREHMPDGGSLVAMSYYGAEKVVPGYNVMGVAKAALEANARYLAAELGAANIRVNTISAGPIRTLSSMAVGGVDDMFGWVERKAPVAAEHPGSGGRSDGPVSGQQPIQRRHRRKYLRRRRLQRHGLVGALAYRPSTLAPLFRGHGSFSCMGFPCVAWAVMLPDRRAGARRRRRPATANPKGADKPCQLTQKTTGSC